MGLKKGAVVFFGAIRVCLGGTEKQFDRALIIEFDDTESLERSVNSGFGEFDLIDDDVAVVLEGEKRR